MPRLFTKATMILNVVNTAALAGGLTFAFSSGDGHMAQRTGAGLAALTGLFVIWQVIDEIRMERALDLEEPSGGNGFAVDKTAQRLQASATARRGSAIRQARLVMVAMIAIWLSVGEGLHGFGDLMVPPPAHTLAPHPGG